MNIIANISSILIGGGILAFLEFLINRHDEKKNKNGKILSAISDLNVKLEESFADLDAKVARVNEKGDERAAVESRVRILRFADEMQEERWHSKDSWDQCLSDITEYEHFCETHPDFKNNQTAATVSYIQRTYEKRLEKRDFDRRVTDEKEE